MRHFQLFLAFFAAFFLAAPVMAQTQEEAPLVRVRILPERGVIEPGETLWLAIEQIIRPAWHSYWKNPGDSGAEPRITWNLPEGFEASAIIWPTPHKIPYGPLLNYGYSDKVILLQKLTAPENLPDGEIVIDGDFEVLVCKDECIPQFSKHTLRFNHAEGETEDNSGYIAIARALVPDAAEEKVFVDEQDGMLVITTARTVPEEALESVHYFPEDWGLVDNAAPSQAVIEGDRLIIRQKRGERALDEVTNMAGVIAYSAPDGVRESFSFTAQRPGIMMGAVSAILPGKAVSGTQESGMGLALALMFALAGGVILNLMPCVFPVLSMKALSLVKISEKHPEAARLHGISYAAGVILSFIAVAGILFAVKAAGYSAGWGFQLQNPMVVALLAYVLFLVGLNLAGYFEISGAFGSTGQRLTQGSSYSHSFFTGVLATLVATPCTAPFMAGAIGYALVQPAGMGLAVFAALGFGLALPYLALSFIPALQKRLPRPGPWMEHFRHFLAFPMLASAAWLVWVLSQQTGPSGVLGVLLGMLGIGFGIWLLKIAPERGAGRIILRTLAVLALLSPLAHLPETTADGAPALTVKTDMGKVYSPQALEEALAGDAAVFVEMTAAWCITCKVNHAVAINIPSTRRVFGERNVEYMIGDWTTYDPAITEFLNRYGRDGVPLYVYYGSRRNGERPEPKVLPQILTPGTVANIVEESFNQKGE